MAFVLLSTLQLRAQTTLTTLPNPPYNGGNSLTGPAQVTFVMQNTNGFPILLTNVSQWCTSAENNSVWQLYATTTALSGNATDVTVAPWTLVATSTALPAVAVSGITPLPFAGLSYTIPAGATVRFALRNTGPGSCRYSGTGAVLTPNTFSGGGVNLQLGDVQIAGQQVGWSGSGTALTINPRYFTGAVTFQPAGPCTNPPTVGPTTSSANPVCLGQSFTLSIPGTTGGTGQTFQWESAPAAAGPWTPITGATGATYTTTQAVSTFYRCVVTCGASATSMPLQVVSPGLVSGTFTINSALPTGGTNFNSFNAAYNYIKCGINGPVIFNVDAASGPYNEQLIMDPVPGASAVNTVTFNGNGRTITFNSTNTNERAVIKLNGADHIKFNNLVITAPGTLTTEFGFGVQLLNNADSNAVQNCTINLNTTSTSTNYAGIVVSASATSAVGTGSASCDGNIFSDNTITGGYYGMTLVSSTTVSNARNIARRNLIRETYNYGIYMLGNFDTQIDSNTITRPTRATVTTLFSIFVTGLNTKVNITRNTITNPFGGAAASTSIFYGIYFTGVDALPTLENVVSNNKINNIGHAGDAYGIYNTSSDNVWYYHNTISLDGAGTGTTGTTVTRGFFQTTLAAGIEFRNNIVSVTRGGISAKHCIYFATATSTIISNRNDFYLNAPAGTNSIGFSNGANRVTLADWQANTTQDANSISTNPIFANLSSGNLAPTNASVNDLGTPVGINIDILGNARSSTTPDMGAYEFTPGGCVAPPTPGTAGVSNTPVCVNTNVTLTLSGNSFGLGQTYQWQSSPNIGGPYTSFGPVLTNPDLAITSSATLYYRCAVTCSGGTEFSTPVLLTVNPALPGGVYTINKTAPASATNFISFNAAYAAMACGIAGPVVLNVVPGTGPYNEQLIMDSIAGTSAINTITFNGNGNTIAFSSDNGNERAVIKLRRTDHIIFDSLVINATGTGAFGNGIQLINNADSNTIRRCTFILNSASTSTNYAGIVINASDAGATTTGATLCDSITIDRNTITGGYYAITAVGSTTDLLNNYRITNNTLREYYSYGIYMYGIVNGLVEANDLARPTRTSLTSHFGIYLTTAGRNVLISKNRIHNPFDATPASTSAFYGIYHTGVDAPVGSENRVENNIMYNITGDGDEYGCYNSSSDNVWYYHNTLSFDNTLSNHTATWWTRPFFHTGQAAGLRYQNNIVTIRRTGFGDRHAMYMATAATTFTSNRNDFFVVPSSDPTSSSAIGFFNGVDQNTLANWQTATSQDANSLVLDPEYTNAATGDLTPLNGSLENLGTPVGVTTDIRNAVRSATTPDAGAFEFFIPPCVNPPTPGTAVVTPNSGICIGTPIRLTLSDNSAGGFQTYQWQEGPSATGPWTTISPVLNRPPFNWEASSNSWYRCIVVCSGGTPQFSAPAQITLNPALLAGNYTINPALPLGGTNYQSFNQAVTALECGITGTVIFNVAAGTYNEQVRMRRVFGASPTSRVIFRSANGNPASVTLTFNANDFPAANYVLKLDSASYITYRDMTITQQDNIQGRVVEIANTATADSIFNCIINTPATTATTTANAAIFANGLRGGDHTIKGNRISNGSHGIYFAGVSATQLNVRPVIDSNTVTGSHVNGIYAEFTNRASISKNFVDVRGPRAAAGSGIVARFCDTSYQIVSNRVHINNTNTWVNGIFVAVSDATTLTRGRVANNIIKADSLNTGIIFGLKDSLSSYNNTVNNIINVSNTGPRSYGIYSDRDNNVNYYNNSVHLTSTSATNNVAMYSNHTSSALGRVNMRNNIFSNAGGGRAMEIPNTNFLYSDYNMLFTSGAVLVSVGATNYANLNAWRNGVFWDVNSIGFRPAFVSDRDLSPKLDDPAVWAIHGRGVQIVGNDYDYNNNPRPVTLQAGVPDLGAIEFVPTSVPQAMVATPAAPAPNTTQVFTFGTDTVARIRWGATVPPTITGRRYSGVIPPGLSAPADRFMYFYTDFAADSGYTFAIDQYYIDPWHGYINPESRIRLAKTNSVGTWTTYGGNLSTLDAGNNFMSKTDLNSLYKFTGLYNTQAPPIGIQPPDSSNRGTRFWVGYGHHQFFTGTNTQEMVLYLSAQQAANVTVKINGTSYVRNYAVPANSVITSQLIPKSGIFDGRLLEEGLSERGISIESDVPIVAYAHIYGSAASGATMLLPVGTYGFEYTALGSRQNYGTDTYSWFYVVAEYDSTVVEITPSQPTLAGRPANVPFTVTLNRGEVYQVLGALIAGAEGYDLTGSRVKSLPNLSGRCLPMAVFSGSSRTGLGCGASAGSSGDNYIQQSFPYQAWGTRYLTAPTSNASAANSLMTNIYRVVVKYPDTVVRRNGVQLTGLINNSYYQFESATADYIDSDKPILVAQFMSSSGSCPNTSGNGDPEMIYLSPVEQAINRIGFYRNTQQAITSNYLTLVIPTAGVASLRIDGSATFDYTYPHPNRAGYTVVVRRWTAAQAQSLVQSDSAFTAITYGLGSVESYGYNAGTLVRNLNGLPAINNVLNPSNSSYTCAKTPFRISILIPVKPTVLTWKISAIPGISPNNDVTQNNPIPVDSVTTNNRKYYKFTLPLDYTISAAGSYLLPILITHPEIEGCNSSLETSLIISVQPAPTTNFSFTTPACVGDPIQFNGTAITTGAVPVNSWSWDFGDASAATIQNPIKTYTTAGNYNVRLRIVASDGCLGDTIRPVTIGQRPVINVVRDSIAVCPGDNVTFTIQSPLAGATYSWYDVPTGGTALATGTSYTVNNVTGNIVLYVDAIQGGCASLSRKRVVAVVLQPLAAPVAVVDTAGVNFVRFRWNAVPGAVGYEVSVNGSTNWVTPSSGPTGLTHTVSGLQPVQTVSLQVRALGQLSCQTSTSQLIRGTSLPDQIYIPNAFTPNGDGRNDVLRVYGYVVKDMQFMIFNQWGEKIFETSNQNTGWDGTYKGKPQPSGVYMYVCKIVTKDGQTIVRKGSINLLR